MDFQKAALPMKPAIYLVGSPEKWDFVTEILRKKGYEFFILENPKAALELIGGTEKETPGPVHSGAAPPRLVLCGGSDGTGSVSDWMEEFHRLAPDLPVMALGDNAAADQLADWMNLGCAGVIFSKEAEETWMARVQSVLERQALLSDYEANALKFFRQLDGFRRGYERAKRNLDSAGVAYGNLIHPSAQGAGTQGPVRTELRTHTPEGLGGDFSQVNFRGQVVDILVADVSGHDAGAAFYAMMIKALFDQQLLAGWDGEGFLRRLNTQLLNATLTERLITAIYVRLDLQKQEAEVVSAAHPMLIRCSRKMPVPRPLKVQGDVLGVFGSIQLEKKRFRIQSGDRLYLHTDGLTNLFRVDGPTGKKERLSEAGLDGLIQTHGRGPLEGVVQNIWNDALAFCRHRVQDDLLLMGVEIP